ncbi:hypothetical protein EPA93_38200 [Ktedonosporobacter rubrisoli]|uniref:Pyrrolo-quinoline quinone repeat domain-containing protein n=1 Tax=Ktedonosporobacter rubrisoli TaxID=2509675 RepID=A0A4P6K100_KTERU|nr:PQQ-binding-like beta-propeller repeat protein [Ktedonosporobacter rubrisoli]QBD81493.1 hypothetical protein EPA93_38200 [Ktedonosporobacter rubrisoli]
MLIRHTLEVIGRRMNMCLLGLLGVAALVLGLLLSPMSGPFQAAASGQASWLTYMGNNAHTGFNGSEAALNPASAHHLKLHWKYKAGGPVSSQVMVDDGKLYWGSWDGYEHATDLQGHQLWQTSLGTDAPRGCFPPRAGVASPATITTLPIQGQRTRVVLVGGGNARFYALNAANGHVLWSTALGKAPDYMIWGGASVYKGSVYVGISSYGDCPLVAGKFYKLDASTGAIEHTFTTVPAGCVGGGIWMTPTIDEARNSVYITTGTLSTCKPYEKFAYALLEFNADDLSPRNSWQIPPAEQSGDGDFGSTPTLFTATIQGHTQPLIGAVNKNGFYYALNRDHLSSGPVWKVRVTTPEVNDKSSISSSAWDGKQLYIANSHTVIAGRDCAGGVRAVNPATGAFLWEHCMPGKIQGSVMAVPGMLAVGSGNFIIALDTGTGRQAFAYNDQDKASLFWGTPTICNGMLYMGNRDGLLYAFGL